MARKPELRELTPELIGRRVKETLEARGMTQAALVRAIGCHPPEISNLVNGRHVPNIFILKRIADALEVRLKNLVDPD